MVKIDGLIFSTQEFAVVMAAVFTLGFLIGGLITTSITHIYLRRQFQKRRAK